MATPDLNEAFALELARALNGDPELRYEVTETRASLREWVTEQVKMQTDDDEMSRVVKRFLRQHLSASEVMRYF